MLLLVITMIVGFPGSFKAYVLDLRARGLNWLILIIYLYYISIDTANLKRLGVMQKNENSRYLNIHQSRRKDRKSQRDYLQKQKIQSQALGQSGERYAASKNILDDKK